MGNWVSSAGGRYVLAVRSGNACTTTQPIRMSMMGALSLWESDPAEFAIYKGDYHNYNRNNDKNNSNNNNNNDTSSKSNLNVAKQEFERLNDTLEKGLRKCFHISKMLYSIKTSSLLNSSIPNYELQSLYVYISLLFSLFHIYLIQLIRNKWYLD